jgi:hypothetical protein
MKDRWTRLAYKAEHVVQLDSELVLGVRIHPADQGDAATLVDAVMLAEQRLRAAGSDLEIDKAAADKGYHKASELELATALGVRTYVPEPRRAKRGGGRRQTAADRRAVRLNRRRVRGTHGRRLHRLRSERVERSFAHVCDTGGARRSWLRGLVNVTKRYLAHVAAHNLAVVRRALFGVGKPRLPTRRGRPLRRGIHRGGVAGRSGAARVGRPRGQAVGRACRRATRPTPPNRLNPWLVQRAASPQDRRHRPQDRRHRRSGSHP